METIKQRAKAYCYPMVFEEGARFVLEQVKEVISHPIRFVEAQEENKSIEVAQIDALNELINQLENK